MGKSKAVIKMEGSRVVIKGDILGRAVELLRRLEQVEHEGSEACWCECPICHATSGYLSESKHYKDCELKAFLTETASIKYKGD